MNQQEGLIKIEKSRTEAPYNADNFEECPPRADAMILSLSPTSAL